VKSWINFIIDKETIETYDKDAESITKLHSTLIPSRVYEIILHYFFKGRITADIGYGTGRYTHG
jgi:hypothetical protein